MPSNGCPRCGELLRQDSDMYGGYFSCIQCGYHKDIVKKLVVPASLYGHQKRGRRPAVRG